MTLTTKYSWDIETDSIPATTIWFAIVKEYDKEVFHTFYDAKSFQKWINENQGAEMVAHNGTRFDIPQVEQKWGVSFKGMKLTDSLTKSRRSYKKRPGGHSAKNWGEVLEFPKDNFTDYDGPATEGEHAGESYEEWLDRNVSYCMQDCRLGEAIDKAVDLELEGTSEQCQEIEGKVAAIIDEQVRTGWLLDVRRCVLLLADLKEKKLELEEEVRRVFVPLPKAVKEITPKVKKDGCFSIVGLKFMGDLWTNVAGVFTRLDYEEFNLGSNQQIARHLQYYGWKPTKFTEPTPLYPKGQVVVDEEALEGCELPQAQLIAEYLMVTKRIAMVASWVGFADENDRVHGEVNSNGAVTGRMTHMNPNVAQVTANDKPYGFEMRSCWIAKPRYRVVGCDADGLELCMLAHYMNDKAYIDKVANGDKEKGTDVHTANKEAAGLDTRDNAKTFIYAFLYGAGDAKIGSIVGGSKAAGKKLKSRFLDATPALKRLRERVEKAARRGWLKGLDGRRIEVRSVYASLNTLLQGAGALVMKQALIFAYEQGKEEGLDFNFIGNIHDEMQAEVLEEDAVRFGEIMSESIVKAGEHFNMRCPLAGTYKIGNSWSETH